HALVVRVEPAGRGTAEAEHADQLVAAEHRDAQRGAQRLVLVHASGKFFVQVVDPHGGARLQYEIAGAGRRGRVAGPEVARAGSVDVNQVVLTGGGIEQPRGAEADVQPDAQALQYAFNQPLRWQQMPQFVANFVDEALLPHQSA